MAVGPKLSNVLLDAVLYRLGPVTHLPRWPSWGSILSTLDPDGSRATSEPFTLLIAQLAYEGDEGPELAYRFERFGSNG